MMQEPPVMPHGALGLLNRVKVRRIDEETPYYDSGLKRSCSWTKNLPAILAVNLDTQPGSTEEAYHGNNIANTSGSNYVNQATGYSASYGPLYMRTYAEATESNAGIQIGTDNTAVTASDYNLGAMIAHGSGAGEALYGATIIGPVNESGTYPEMVIWRSFENESGGALAVEEIGLVVRHVYSGSSSNYFMIARDLLSFSISDGDLATVEYFLRLT
jgi:hypothetical protein